MSLQIEKKWLGEESVDGEKVKILYGQSLKGMDVGGNEVEIIKIDASGDAVVPQGVIASESFVNSEVASEAALRISGDSSTLSSAQSYTDAEVLEEKGLREAEDLLMFKKDGSRTMTGKMNMGSFKIEGLANGVESGEAINKGQLDALELHVEGQISSLETDLEGQISTVSTNLTTEQTARISADNALSSRLDSLESDEVSKSYVDAADLVLDGKISTEKGRIDAILLASSADKDSFAEIVSLINSVDTENDTAFAGYVTSNNAAVAAIQTELDGTQTGAGLGSNGSYSPNTGVSYIGSASSLHDADKKLDVKMKEIADGLAQELLDRASAISSEASSRTSADNALDARLDILEADPTTKTYVDTQDAAKLVEAKAYTDSEVLEEKNRAESAESALDGRLDVIEGKIIEEDMMFEVGVGDVGVNYVELAHTAEKIYKVCVGRLNVFKGVDYTLSIVSGKTKITWIGELASGGASPIATGDKIFVTYIH
jgi:hypothetical protein